MSRIEKCFEENVNKKEVERMIEEYLCDDLMFVYKQPTEDRKELVFFEKEDTHKIGTTNELENGYITLHGSFEELILHELSTGKYRHTNILFHAGTLALIKTEVGHFTKHKNNGRNGDFKKHHEKLFYLKYQFDNERWGFIADELGQDLQSLIDSEMKSQVIYDLELAMDKFLSALDKWATAYENSKQRNDLIYVLDLLTENDWLLENHLKIRRTFRKITEDDYQFLNKELNTLIELQGIIIDFLNESDESEILFKDSQVGEFIRHVKRVYEPGYFINGKKLIENYPLALYLVQRTMHFSNNDTPKDYQKKAWAIIKKKKLKDFLTFSDLFPKKVEQD